MSRITLEGFFVNQIDIFIQGEGLNDILVATSALHHTAGSALVEIISGTGRNDLLLFVEDHACPISPDTLIEELLPLGAESGTSICSLRLHLSCCHHIDVSVRFNGETATRRFSPSATIARVHHWAARRAFGMTPRDAAEHVLEVQGSTKRPDRDIHIGTLAAKDSCGVAFDLVPRKRVEG
jgi:hypothetical protein